MPFRPFPTRLLVCALLAAAALLTSSCTATSPTGDASPAAGVKQSPQADLASCQQNLKLIATAAQMYAHDSAGKYPPDLKAITPLYLKTLPTCPAARLQTYDKGYVASPSTFTVMCVGTWHAAAGVGANYPQYSPAGASPIPLPSGAAKPPP